MTDSEILTEVKNGLGIYTDFQDLTLKVYINDVKAFMKRAGVKQSVIESSESVGVILRGVADLWNYGSGSTTLSDYFKMCVIQLSMEGGDSDV